MERLTRRNEKGQVTFETNCPYGCKYFKNSDCGHECETDCMEKLAEYEDAEEQGFMLRLPCRAGDTVYHVVSNMICEVENVDLFFLLLSVAENRFGKTVFLTKEAAEQALSEMKEV